MDIPTAMTDENYVISAIDECQLNMNNLGHEWYSRAYHFQTLLDATGDSTNTPAGTTQQYFDRTFTISFITALLSEMKPLFHQCRKSRQIGYDLNGTNEHYQ